VRIKYLHSIRIVACVIAMFLSLTLFSQEEELYDGEQDEEQKAFYFDKHEGTVPRLYTRKLPEKQVTEWKNDDAFWYANTGFEKKENAEKADRNYVPVAKRTWFQTLLWFLIIGGFMGVLFWFLSENRVGLFSRKRNATESDPGEEIPEDIFAINYQKEIDQAVKMENYRLAVRLMFLRLLKTMSEKNVIQYRQEKTNLDYLLDTHQRPFYKDFFKVVRNYEYSWYGLFEVNRDGYSMISKDFEQLEKQLYRL
jgi:hypothetical protein